MIAHVSCDRAHFIDWTAREALEQHDLALGRDLRLHLALQKLRSKRYQTTTNWFAPTMNSQARRIRTAEEESSDCGCLLPWMTNG